MNKFLVSKTILYDSLYKAIIKAATETPSDVKKALQHCLKRETAKGLASLNLSITLSNLKMSEAQELFACSDTGYPLYYVRLGDGVQVEGGYSVIEKLCARAVEKATKNNRLRSTMVHPLTRYNPGTNVFQFIPKVEIKFDPNIDYMEITAVPKGGGSEIFGTFYRMTTPVDGLKGIKKFVFDSTFHALQSGKTCPPNILGIGIGGTADLCMKLAKESALLRPIGDHHPEKIISELEEELNRDINSLRLGPMGMGGACSVLDVHIEYAASHTAALPIAFNSQCSICRRATVRIFANGNVSWRDYPDWFGRDIDD